MKLKKYKTTECTSKVEEPVIIYARKLYKRMAQPTKPLPLKQFANRIA